jgi:hypothetical protein
MTEQKRLEYCNDCKRSIYGKYKDCDVNIENNGNYVGTGDICHCSDAIKIMEMALIEYDNAIMSNVK